MVLYAALNGNNVELSWNSLGDNIYYEVHRGNSSGFAASSSTLISQTESTSFVDSNIDSTQLYYYYLVAYSKATNAPINASNELAIAGSNYGSATTPDSGNNQGSNGNNQGNQGNQGGSSTVTSMTLNAQATSQGVLLEWNAPSSDEYQYYVFRGESPDFAANNANQIGKSEVITTTAYNDSTAQSGHTYYYKVLAYDRTDSSKEPISASTSISV